MASSLQFRACRAFGQGGDQYMDIDTNLPVLEYSANLAVSCALQLFFLVFVFFWLSVCSYFCKMAVLLFCCKFTIFQYVHDYVGLTHRLWKAKANNMCKAAYELID